jgi:hypothetical protein
MALIALGLVKSNQKVRKKEIQVKYLLAILD